MRLPLPDPPETWTEEHLKKLCDGKVPENQRLDYKRELNIDSRDARFDVLKDITALANSDGGVIIYGIEEEKDKEMGAVAGRLTPLSGLNPVDQINRIIRTSVSPAMECYFYPPIQASAGGFYIVAYVPQSLFRPHAVVRRDRLEWYVRRNQDNFPLTEPELREMYYRSNTFRQSLEQRYNNLDLDFGFSTCWLLTTMPILSNSEMLDTLSRSGQSLVTPSYIEFFGGSNGLKPKVDRFEEISEGLNGEFSFVRMFKDGGFVFGEGYSDPKANSIGTENMYFRWFGALRYFGEIYQEQNYHGPLRVWFQTKGLDSSLIPIVFPFPKTIQQRGFVISKDSTVDLISNNPFDICNAFLKYLGQSCDVTVSDATLQRIECLVLKEFSQ